MKLEEYILETFVTVQFENVCPACFPKPLRSEKQKIVLRVASYGCKQSSYFEQRIQITILLKQSVQEIFVPEQDEVNEHVAQ
jgi:hypothetical protein